VKRRVAVGSLFGIGLLSGKANPRGMTGIVLSWVITLPCAALIGASAYAVIRHL
jgi:PiT family inorganic phosphate transporter